MRVYMRVCFFLHKWHKLLNDERWPNRLATRNDISYRNQLYSMNVVHKIFDCSLFDLIEAEENSMNPRYTIHAIFIAISDSFKRGYCVVQKSSIFGIFVGRLP